MSKIYLVYIKSTGYFKGALRDKIDYKTFKEQREMEKFEIVKVDEDDIASDEARWEIENSFADMYFEKIVFPDELEVHTLSLDQLRIDMHRTILSYLQSFKPYLKLSDEESEKIDDFLAILYEALSMAEKLGDEGIYDEECGPTLGDMDLNDIFQVDRLLKITLEQF